MTRRKCEHSAKNVLTCVLKWHYRKKRGLSQKESPPKNRVFLYNQYSAVIWTVYKVPIASSTSSSNGSLFSWARTFSSSGLVLGCLGVNTVLSIKHSTIFQQPYYLFFTSSLKVSETFSKESFWQKIKSKIKNKIRKYKKWSYRLNKFRK